MTTHLSVPPRSASPDTPVETRPARVKAWLDQLPLLNIADTSHQVLAGLTALNRMALDDRTRLELLELYRVPVRRLCLEMQRLYVGQPLPLPGKTRMLAEKNRQFQVEMAYGYKHLVRSALGRDRARGSLALPIHRALRHLTEVLVRSYQFYTSSPPGTWTEIHGLYRLAEEHNLVHEPLADPLNTALPTSSIEHVYKQALLLDLCDPYHLPVRMVGKIYHYLDRWASEARLLPATSQYNATCQFLIDQQADRAGRVYSGDTAITNTEHYRLLNTYDLARVIHRQLSALHSGQAVVPDGLEPDFFDDGTQEMLTRLINTWGMHPTRAYRRNPRTHDKMDVAVGIVAINYWLNGGRRFLPSAYRTGPRPQRTAVGAPPGSVAQDTEAVTYSAWDVLDESAGGMAFATLAQPTMRVRVGDLVATRPVAADGAWSVGSIRWIRSVGGGRIEIGTQRLAPSAQPVAIQTVEAGQASHLMPVLLLPEVKPLRQPCSLLTHRGVFKSGRVLLLDDGVHLRRIECTTLIELTALFERFQFQPA